MSGPNERGMTMVEVVLAIVIAGIIVPALIEACLVGLRTLDGTNQRLAGSNDTLLIASYFTSDVDGASSVATSGARGHITPTVALPPGTTSTALVLMYAARGSTTLYAPPTAGAVWNAPATSLTSSLADELLRITEDNQNDTLARVGTTLSPTASATHTIALRPTSSAATVTRRGEAHGAVTNGSSLVVSKPSGVVENDTLVAHITAATTAAKVTAPAGWTQVDQVDLSPTLTSLAFVRTAGLTEPLNWTWGFTAGAGTHDIAGGIVAYTNISTSAPIAAHATASNPCGGETPVLSIATADRADVSSVAYFLESNADERQLVRRECGAGGLASKQVLARALDTSSGATAACAPASCDPLPVSVVLTLREPPLPHETLGRSYVLSARSRTG